MHERAKLDTLSIRKDKHLLSFMFGRAHDPTYTDVTNRRTRQSIAPLLRVPFARLDKYTRAPCIRGSGLWNALPTKIRNAGSKLEFKKMVARHMCGVLSTSLH